MRSFTYSVLIILAGLSLFSCTSTTRKYHPVHSKAPRISSLGFYISPPPGSDWYEKHHEDSLFYFKNTEGKNYALTTQATELFFENKVNKEQEIIEYIEKRRQQFLSDISIKNSQFDYTVREVATSLCVRYQHSYDDYGNKKKGPYPFVRIFSKGLVCRHPNSPRIGIDINYMEKTFPDMNPPSFRSEGELFISSLNFFNT